MNFMLEQALRVGMLELIGHAVPPSLAGAHPNLVKVENAWVDQVMAYVESKRRDFPMPPSWLLVSAVLPEVSALAAAAMGIAAKHRARIEPPVSPAPEETKPVPAPAAPAAPAVDAPVPSVSEGATVPRRSEEKE